MQDAEIRDDLKSAITNKDTSALADLLHKSSKEYGTKQTQHLLRCEVLLDVPHEANEWFWSHSMSRLEYEKLTSSIYRGVLVTLIKNGKRPGIDFSAAPPGKGKRKRQLLVTKNTHQELLKTLSKERHSALRLIVREP